jgi:hypothetical protein
MSLAAFPERFWQLGDVYRDPPRLNRLCQIASSHSPRPRFFRRLSPFPFAGLRIVAGDTALDHFIAPFVARHDERGENTAAKAKRAERYEDDELQPLTHRSNLASLAIFAVIRRASSLLTNLAADRRPGSVEQ